MDSNLSGKQVVLCDPMLATGGSAIYAINLLKSAGALKIFVLHASLLPNMGLNN